MEITTQEKWTRKTHVCQNPQWGFSSVCQYVSHPWTFGITLIHHLFVFLPRLFYKPHVWSILCAPRRDKKATYASFSQHFRRFKESLKRNLKGVNTSAEFEWWGKVASLRALLVVEPSNQAANILILKRCEWPHEDVGVFDTSNTFQASIEPCVAIAFVGTSTRALLSLGGALENWCMEVFYCLWSRQTKQLPS